MDYKNKSCNDEGEAFCLARPQSTPPKKSYEHIRLLKSSINRFAAVEP